MSNAHQSTGPAATAAGLTAEHEHEHHDHSGTTTFGFWLYLMTDCILFGTLFAVFAVMHNEYAGGPGPRELFELKGVAFETAALLLSSITYGFAMLCGYKGNRSGVMGWLLVTLLLGITFVTLEVHEFALLIADGHGPQQSGFLSAFFTLVATHGIHVTLGMVWMVVMMFQVMGKNGLNQRVMTRLSCLSLFWHFLDVIWICVFTFVYLVSMV
ncbi:cytochrome o ubiquinol oxidase subunit 3 [Robbsia andropogonis]|uniref:cytochrome o ubiquinol oxidase subunit III n=1 Tax=Robbsia andropogonis TaxID=28092 RepID=UPI003D254179